MRLTFKFQRFSSEAGDQVKVLKKTIMQFSKFYASEKSQIV